MNKVFYPRIAMINLRNNGRTYVPYLLTCILSTAMFYVICSLSLNPDLDTMLGGGYMRTLLQMGTWIVGFFVIIFLFYTNSFLMKRRKKEFGVFNILGMEKRHISKVIAYETLFTALVSLLAGISLGIVLERLLYYALGAMMAGGGALTFNISVEGIRTTLILFAIIHLLIFLSSRWQIRLANPIQLLHGSSYGEREPKARWLMALLGLISLGAGYAIAVLTKNPLNALLLFFVAVLLVIIGTYLLFTSGSIAVLKLLKKNRRYYYKPTHFINTSTMMYRMKQNAVSLANICILSTMVLVMLSTTISLWVGMDDAARTRYPREIAVSSEAYDAQSKAEIDARIETALKQNGLQAHEPLRYTSLQCISRGRCVHGLHRICPLAEQHAALAVQRALASHGKNDSRAGKPFRKRRQNRFVFVCRSARQKPSLRLVDEQHVRQRKHLLCQGSVYGRRIERDRHSLFSGLFHCITDTGCFILKQQQITGAVVL